MAISERKAYKELIWYYCSSSADLGICSSFGSIIASAFGFSPSNSVNHVENKMVGLISQPRGSPIRKLRKIEKALATIPIQHRRVLDAIYGNYIYPPQLTSVFGLKTGAALFNTKLTELPKLISLCNKRLSKNKLTPEEQLTLQQIEEQKELLFAQAHQTYLRERAKHDLQP